jgi:hypothetical protein
LCNIASSHWAGHLSPPPPPAPKAERPAGHRHLAPRHVVGRLPPHRASPLLRKRGSGGDALSITTNYSTNTRHRFCTACPWGDPSSPGAASLFGRQILLIQPPLLSF